MTDCFYISTIGQLESAHFPLGTSSKFIHCRYEVIHGPDWELVSGAKTGITQSASTANDNFQTIAFNMPLEFTFKSTNPYGWPQLVFNIYGDNVWGTEVSRGNTRIHVPLGGDARQVIESPLVTPKPLDLCSQLIAYFTDWSPEFRDITVLAQGNRTKGISTESYGSIRVCLRTISRGQRALGFDWTAQS